jgi:hypothetical protein
LLKLSLATLALAVLGGGVIEAAIAEPRNPKQSKIDKSKMGYGEKISHKIGKHIQGTHYCQEKLDSPKTEVRLLFTKRPIEYRRYVLGVWIERHDKWCDKYRTAKKRGSFFGRPPHYNEWLCIHSHEGSWKDTGDPYWGGLQMDKTFMNSYAPDHLLRRGWAHTWTPIEQMWVAENAYRTRGFYPWPNTARMCGLI